MPLDDTYPLAVAFIVSERERAGVMARRAIGTGFHVGMPSEAFPKALTYGYVVTAKHVIQGEAQTWVRVNVMHGPPEDIPVPRWYVHDEADVAVAPMGHVKGRRIRFVPDEAFVDKWAWNPQLGDRVYFIGLLSGIESMEQGNVPMVRAGTLGRMYQDGIPVKRPDETIDHVSGHLIDCRSIGGFSGSPCFIQATTTRFVTWPTGPDTLEGGPQEREEIALLGMVTGHFDEWQKAKTTGDFDGTVESVANRGVGIIVPAEAIRQVIEGDQDLIKQRKARDAKGLEKEETAATLDSAAESAAFRREDFMRDLRKIKKQPKAR